MVIPNGYKQTRVGVIPEDWDIIYIKNIGDIITGSTPSRSDKTLWNGDFPWINAQDFRSKYIYNSVETLTDKGKKCCRVLPPDSVLITCIASIGLNAISKVECATNQQINAIICSRLYSSEFVYYYISNEKENLLNLAGQTAVPIINKSQFENYSIAIPKLEEQQKIAEVLSDTDELIFSLEKLIAKYEAIKQSCLQNMFPRNGEIAPKMRLPGFTEDWEQRELIDMLSQPITDGPHETPKLVDDGIPFISVDAIIDNKIDFTRKRGFITEAYDNLCCKKYKPQLYDVYLVKSGSTVGKVAIVETTDKFNIWSPLAAMRCDDKSDAYFLYFLLQTNDLQNQVFDKASHGTQPNLSMRQLEKLNICIPTNIEEQEAIGDYFKQLDNLITLHQRKLEKYKKIKQGMMQQLLTGKIRLV